MNGHCSFQDDLTLQLSAMSTSATSNGAMERLVSSSETSLEMEGGDDEEERSKDEVRRREGGTVFWEGGDV